MKDLQRSHELHGLLALPVMASVPAKTPTKAVHPQKNILAQLWAETAIERQSE